MPDEEKPIGQRFSQVYLNRGAPQDDSRKMRARLYAYYSANLIGKRDDIARSIHINLGTDIRAPAMSGMHPDFQNFFHNSKLHELLDSITLIARLIGISLNSSTTTAWLSFVNSVFTQENLCYRVDEKGGVHYHPDEEFEQNKVSALSCLTDARYTAVAHEFNDAHEKLNSIPLDTKAATRSIFEAAEILVRLMVGSQNLSKHVVNERLKPLAKTVYSNDVTVATVADHMLNSFSEWIDGIHNFRHGQPVEEPTAPPPELAVQILSSGASYIRWLVELDQKKLTQES